MAPRKKSTTDKEPAKKKPARKRRTTAKKSSSKKPAPKEKEVKVEEEDLFPAPMAIFGELFWEYRAKMAEYEKALIELQTASKDLNTEKLDPKYEKLLNMMAQETRLREQLKQYAELLRGVQLKVAKHLDVDIKTFLKDCIVDHETGVVKIID